MSSRKEFEEAGRRKLEEFRRAKAQAKSTANATPTKATAAPAVSESVPGHTGQPTSTTGFSAPTPVAATWPPNGVPNVSVGTAAAPARVPQPVMHMPPGPSPEEPAVSRSAPPQPASGASPAEPSPSKAPPTAFVVLQDAPIPFGAFAAPAGGGLRGTSNSGAAAPADGGLGVSPWPADMSSTADGGMGLLAPDSARAFFSPTYPAADAAADEPGSSAAAAAAQRDPFRPFSADAVPYANGGTATQGSHGPLSAGSVSVGSAGSDTGAPRYAGTGAEAASSGLPAASSYLAPSQHTTLNGPALDVDGASPWLPQSSATSQPASHYFGGTAALGRHDQPASASGAFDVKLGGVDGTGPGGVPPPTGALSWAAPAPSGLGLAPTVGVTAAQVSAGAAPPAGGPRDGGDVRPPPGPAPVSTPVPAVAPTAESDAVGSSWWSGHTAATPPPPPPATVAAAPTGPTSLPAPAAPASSAAYGTGAAAGNAEQQPPWLSYPAAVAPAPPEPKPQWLPPQPAPWPPPPQQRMPSAAPVDFSRDPAAEEPRAGAGVGQPQLPIAVAREISGSTSAEQAREDSALHGSSSSRPATPTAGLSGYDFLSDAYLDGGSRPAQAATDAVHVAAAVEPVSSGAVAGAVAASAAPAVADAASPPLPLSFGAVSPGAPGSSRPIAARNEAQTAPAASSAPPAQAQAPDPEPVAPAPPPRASRFAWLFGSPPPAKTQPAAPAPKQQPEAAPAAPAPPPIMTQTRSLAASDSAQPPTAPAAMPGPPQPFLPNASTNATSNSGDVPEPSPKGQAWSLPPTVSDGMSSMPDAFRTESGDLPLGELSLRLEPAHRPAAGDVVAPIISSSQPSERTGSSFHPSLDAVIGIGNGLQAFGAAPNASTHAATEWLQSVSDGMAGTGPAGDRVSPAGPSGTGARAGYCEDGPFGQQAHRGWDRGGTDDGPAAGAAGDGGWAVSTATASSDQYRGFSGRASEASSSAASTGGAGAGGSLPSFLRNGRTVPADPPFGRRLAREGSGDELSFGGAPPAPPAAADAAPLANDIATVPSFSTSFPALPRPAPPAPSARAGGLPPLPPPPPVLAAGAAANPQFSTTASYLSAYSAQTGSASGAPPPSYGPAVGGGNAASTSSFLDSYLDNLLTTMSAEKADAAATAGGGAAAGSGAVTGAHSAPGGSAAVSRRTSQAGDLGAEDGEGAKEHEDGHEAGEAAAADGDGGDHLASLPERGLSGGEGGAARRGGALPQPESSVNLRDQLSRRQSMDSADVVSVYSHATGHTHGMGGGYGGPGGRAQFAALQQHIDELTEEKLALSRGLAAQTRINAQLAEENEALMRQYNERGAAVEELERKLKQYEQELAAQALTLEGFAEERAAVRLSFAEASSRSQALASEVVGLEAQLLQLKSAVLKAERAAEEATARQRKLEKQVATLTAEASERAQELQQTQLKGRNVVVKLKQTESKLAAAEEKLAAQAAALAAGGQLGNGHAVQHVSAPPPPPPKPETAEQEVQCDLVAEGLLPSQLHRLASTDEGAAAAGAGASANGGPSARLSPSASTVSFMSDGPAVAGAVGHGANGLQADAHGRELALATASSLAPNDPRDGPSNHSGTALVDLEALRPQRDAPSAVVAERALASLDTRALRAGASNGGGDGGSGLPEGLAGVAGQLARWLPAGPISGGDPVAVMAEEELRLMQSIHGLLAEFEAAQEASAGRARELEARVSGLVSENEDLRGKLALQTQRLELLMAGGLAGSAVALPGGPPLSLHQTPSSIAPGSTASVSLAAVTPVSPGSQQPAASGAAGPHLAPDELLTTPTRSTRQDMASPADSPVAGGGAPGNGASPNAPRQQSWMGYLFRPRQNKKRVRTAIL